MNYSLRLIIFLGLMVSIQAGEQEFKGSRDRMQYLVQNEITGSVRIQVTIDGVVLTSTIDKTVVSKCQLSDLDEDGFPELYLFVVADPGMYAYEIEGQVLKRIIEPFPPVDLLPYYRGRDRFELKNDNLVRHFPAYAELDGDDNPSLGRYSIAYKFMNNSLVTEKVELQESEPGLYSHRLEIRVESIELNSLHDEMTKSDIYFRIMSDDRHLITSPITPDQQVAVYDTTFIIKDYEKGLLRIDVYDSDVFSDDYIGSIKLADLKSGKYNLTTGSPDGSTVVTGRINLDIKLQTSYNWMKGDFR